MIEKRSTDVDITMIRPDGPIRDDVDRLSRFLPLEDLARIEVVQLKRQAAALEAQLRVVNMTCEMLEKKYSPKGKPKGEPKGGR
jgi:hypothetical protein